MRLDDGGVLRCSAGMERNTGSVANQVGVSFISYHGFEVGKQMVIDGSPRSLLWDISWFHLASPGKSNVFSHMTRRMRFTFECEETKGSTGIMR